MVNGDTNTSTNECLELYTVVKSTCNNGGPFDRPGTQSACCDAVFTYHESNCGCSSVVKLVAGPFLSKDVNTRLRVLCELQDTTQDPTPTHCKALETHFHGCSTISDDKLEADRVWNVMEFGAFMSCFGDQSCLDLKAFQKQLEELTDDTPIEINKEEAKNNETSLPGPLLDIAYGGGNFTGIDGMSEYLSINFPSVTREMWLPDSNRTEIFIEEPGGSRIKLITHHTGEMGGVPYENAPGISYFEYRRCETRFNVMKVIPSKGFASLVELHTFMASEYKRYGAQDICRYHDAYCKGENQQFADNDECMTFMESLPIYTEVCTDQRVLGGNSLTCRYKHHFMIPMNPHYHCHHIGVKGGPDPDGKMKCVDSVECAGPVDPGWYPLNVTFIPNAIVEAAALSNEGWQMEELPSICVPNETVNDVCVINNGGVISTGELPLWARISEGVIMVVILLLPTLLYARYCYMRNQLKTKSCPPRISLASAATSNIDTFERIRLSRVLDSKELEQCMSSVLESDGHSTSFVTQAPSIGGTHDVKDACATQYSTVTENSVKDRPNPDEKLSSLPMVILRNLSLCWEREDSTPVLFSQLFALGGCKVTGVMGSSGIGKTSFMKLLAGFPPSHMKLSFETDFLPRIKFCCSNPDSVWLPEMLVRDILLLSSTMADSEISSYQGAFDSLGVTTNLDRRFGTLSAGQKQRVHIAAAIIMPEPSIILLDEPLSALDETNALACLQMLKTLPTQHSFVLTVHMISSRIASHLDRVITLDPLQNETMAVTSGPTSFELESEQKAQSQTTKAPEPSFFKRVFAVLVLWYSHFFGLPFLGLAVGVGSVIGAVVLGVSNQEVYLNYDGPFLPTSSSVSFPYLFLNLLSACIFIISMCVSYIYVAREQAILDNFVPQGLLGPGAYTIGNAIRLTFYALLVAAIWISITYAFLKIDYHVDTAIFTTLLFTAAWGAFTFWLFLLLPITLAVCVVTILNLFHLSRSGLSQPMRVGVVANESHYVTPIFFTLSANAFLAIASLDTGCHKTDAPFECVAASDVLYVADIIKFSSAQAQAFNAGFFTLSLFLIYLVVHPRRLLSGFCCSIWKRCSVWNRTRRSLAEDWLGKLWNDFVDSTENGDVSSDEIRV